MLLLISVAFENLAIVLGVLGLCCIIGYFVYKIPEGVDEEDEIFDEIAKRHATEASRKAREERERKLKEAEREKEASEPKNAPVPEKVPGPVKKKPPRGADLGKVSGYLEKFRPVVDEMWQFCRRMAGNSDLGDLLKRHVSEDSDDLTMEQLFAIVALSDWMICSERLGHPISRHSEDSCGFFALYLKIGILPRQVLSDSEEDVYRFFSLGKEIFRNMMSGFKQLKSQIQEKGKVFVFPAIFEGNEALVVEYFGLLFRYSTVLANIDNKLSQREIQFLQKLESPQFFVNPSPKDSPAQSKKSATAEEELRALVGLESVKREIQTFKNFLMIRRERESKGLPVPPTSFHLVFSGNPGTGKTTIARIVARIFRELGILSKGHLVEASRSDLVAGYVGQTAIKTNKVIDSALDGVLFIDEAYTLSKEVGWDYGQEAIDTLLKRMEDNRDRLVVIVAGYTDEIKSFIQSNPGLSSRFNRYIDFPDYSAAELLEIFKRLLSKYRYTLDGAAEVALERRIDEAVLHKDKFFGNGRFVRNLFEKSVERQANRLASAGDLSKLDICKMLSEDIL